MTDKTPAMPELPEPGYWSTRDDDTPLYTADQMRAYALTALQSAQPAEVSDEEIERVFQSCGGKWDGDMWVIEDADFHPAIRAILALRPQAVPMTDEEIEEIARGKSNHIEFARAIEAHHGITQRADAAHQPAKEQ